MNGQALTPWLLTHCSASPGWFILKRHSSWHWAEPEKAPQSRVEPHKDVGAPGGKQVTENYTRKGSLVKTPRSCRGRGGQALLPAVVGDKRLPEHTSSTNPLQARASVHFHPHHHHYTPTDANKPLKETEMSGHRKCTHGHHSRRSQGLELCCWRGLATESYVPWSSPVILVDFSSIICNNL